MPFFLFLSFLFHLTKSIKWRMEEPDFEKPFYMQPEETMICGICKEVTKRKNLGFPKRMIKSVANWWWVNQHDEQGRVKNNYCIELSFKIIKFYLFLSLISYQSVYC